MTGHHFNTLSCCQRDRFVFTCFVCLENPPEQPQQPKTQCEHHRDSVQTTSPEGYPIVGAFVPQCDANGQYTPQQVSTLYIGDIMCLPCDMFINLAISVSRLYWTLLVCRQPRTGKTWHQNSTRYNSHRLWETWYETDFEQKALSFVVTVVDVQEVLLSWHCLRFLLFKCPQITVLKPTVSSTETASRLPVHSWGHWYLSVMLMANTRHCRSGEENDLLTTEMCFFEAFDSI